MDPAALAAFPWEDLIYAVITAIAAFLGGQRGGKSGVNGARKLQ